MSLQRLAEAVIELAAKIALGNPRIATNPSAGARESILARNPHVPFNNLERGVADRLGALVESTDSRAVELVEQTLNRAVVGQRLISDDISVDDLVILLGGESVSNTEPVAAYGSLLRACCWEVLDAVRALWSHLNAPTGGWRPRWRQLYSGGPIRSLASIQLETGPYIVAGGENGTVMLDQFTGTTAQVDRHDTQSSTVVAAGFSPTPAVTSVGKSKELRVHLIPQHPSETSSAGHVFPIYADVRAVVLTRQGSVGIVCVAGGAGITVWADNKRRALDKATFPTNALTTVDTSGRPILIAAGPKGSLFSYDLASGSEGRWRAKLSVEIAALEGLVLANTPHVLVGGAGGSLSLHNLSTGEAKELVGHSESVHDIALIEDTDRPIAITAAGSIRVWDLVAGEQITASLGNAHAVTAVRHLDRDYLLTGMDDGIYVTDITELIKAPEPWEHAGFATDTATGPGRLGISDDVDTLAALMLAKEVVPPLAIGLFGDWGTGKSFFMTTLNQRIKQLAADSTVVEESAFCGRVRQIEFNAWHYADANLWASLASAIFDGLAVEDEPESPPSAEGARGEFVRQRDEAEQKLETVKQDLESNAKMPVEFRDALRHASLPEKVVRSLDAKSAAELSGFFSRVRFLFHRAGWPMRVLMLATVALVVVGPWLVSTLIPSWMLSVFAVAAAAGTGIVLRATEALRTAEEIVRKADELRREPLQRLIEKYEGEKTEAVARIEEIDKARSVRALAVERVTKAVYQKHEGIISLIRRDLKELSSRLKLRADVERIVLYIDDLDRCPPDRVVEVLQAVHLLLALPLFVVVVGVDSRWLLRSLRHHYADLMQSHETPQNYLEKIFQISLCLRPMTQQGYADLVTADLLPELVSPEPADNTDTTVEHTDVQKPADIVQQVEDPQPEPEPVKQATKAGKQAATAEQRQRVIARALRLNRDERQLLIQAHPLIGTPRSAKRLVNVYRLLRAGLRPHEREQFVDGEFRAVIVLLGILVGFPIQGADLLNEIGTHKESTLLEVLDSHREQPTWRPLADAVRRVSATTDIPQDAETYAGWAPRVARYSFRTGHLFSD